MRKKKYLLAVLATFILLLSISITVFADGATGSVTGGGSGKGGGTGGGSTMTVQNGCSYKKTGFIFYIVDQNGNVVKSPIARRTYSNIGCSGSHIRCLDTRFAGSVSDIDNESMQNSAYWWNMPPFDENGNGNGGLIKDWCLQKTSDTSINVLIFIMNTWDMQTAVDFVAYDQYLIIEPFMWSGIYNGSSYEGDIVGTAIGWVNARDGFGLSASSGYETRYSMGGLPNSMAFSIPVLGVSAPANIYGKHSYDEIKSQGYGVIAVWAKELKEENPQPPSITVTNTSDYLRANELNYVFADIKEDSSAMREADTYDDAKFGINAELESVWKKHVTADDRNQAIKDGKWYIEETITSDIVNKLGLSNGLFYRSAAGKYFRPSDAVGLKTVNKGSGMQYAGYGYNLTRTVFDDNMVISSFSSRGDNQSMKSYVKDTLKFDVGHDGVKSNIVMNDNTEGQTSDTAQDKYSFVGKVTEYYEHNDKIHHPAEYEDEYGIDVNGKYSVVGQKKVKDEWDEPNWNSYTADHTTDTKQHDVTHGLYKYTPYNITTVPNASAGNRLLATGHIGQAYSKVSFATQQSGVLKIYPEVKYEMWYMGGTETWSTPQKKNIYVMGEKQRSCKPAIIHGYNVYIQGGQMRGQTIVDSPLTGTLANDFSNSWSADGSFQSEYEVCTQGSGFETATTNAPKIDFASFGLDLNESSINGFTPKGTWESASPLDSHMGFVFAVLGNVDSEVKMRRYNQSNQPQGQEYDMSFDISDNIISSTTKQQIKIVFENGAVTTGKTEVINAIASAYGVSTSEATTIWNNSGIENQLREMMETSASANNNSGNVVETPDNWYDETSECLTITVCKTTVTFGKILLSDKHDYGSSTSQSETNITSVGNGGYQCRYFYSLKFTSDSINVDGFNLDVSGTKYLIHDNEIKGARFLVSNSTTSNMRK